MSLFLDTPSYPTQASGSLMARAYVLLAVLLGITGFGVQYGLSHLALAVALPWWVVFLVLIGLTLLLRPSLRLGLLPALLLLGALAGFLGFVLAVEVANVLRFPQGAGVLSDTLAMTGAVTLGLSAYAWHSKRDFSAWRGFFTVGLVALLVGLVVNLFLQIPAFQMALSGVGTLVFSGLLVLDTERLRSSQTTGDAILIVAGLYLDIVNLFSFLLQIFAGTSRD